MATEIDAREESIEGIVGEPDGVLIPRESEIDPTVSVVLPTMNEEPVIAECIKKIWTTLRARGDIGEVLVFDSTSVTHSYPLPNRRSEFFNRYSKWRCLNGRH